MATVTQTSHKRLLITGASGFLGWHLCRLAQGQWQVHGTYHRHPNALIGGELHSIDLTQKADVQALLRQLQPDAVIHTAALSQPNRCEQNPDLSHAINVEATQTLAEFCGKAGVPFVFTSSEQVFSGQSAPYQEADLPDPINCYGRHKAEAEQWIQQLHPRAVICRMPLMYGPPSPTAESFVQGFIRTLKTHKPLSLFVDEYRTPAYVEDAANGLLLALVKGSGILHLGGPERISRYNFGLILAEIFELDSAFIKPCRQADVPMPAVRPADVSTSNQRALALGYCPRNTRAGLTATRSSSSDERRASRLACRGLWG
jgi:dTDP-4-dehydrorhamnose reductase